jgi:hypothetical protein
MSSVNLSWLSQVNVLVNTTVNQAPSFNGCMVIGVFPPASKPAAWGTNLTYSYSSYAQISADFSSKITGTALQDNRYQWLLNAASVFFAQLPTPTNLVVSCLDPTLTNYVTALQSIFNSNNIPYAFYVADAITATQVTQANGWAAALVSQRSLVNPKKMFMDVADSGTIAATIQTAGGSNDLYIFNHAQNLTPIAGSTSQPVSLAAACMGAYFTNLFTSSVGLKSISGMQLQGIPGDSTITTSAMGIPGTTVGLIPTNNNVYPLFGNAGLALVQYGYASSSKAATQVYIDQIVGADYIQLTVQADLANVLVNQQPLGGLPYDDSGIQVLVAAFKGSLNKAVLNKVILPFKNSDIIYLNKSQVPVQDIANKIYQSLSANLTYLSRIQRLAVNCNISI